MNEQLKVKYIPIGDLKDWDENPRINDEAAGKLTKLIEVHGFINPIIITPDMKVRAGHTRIKAAKLMGIEKVPAMIVEFDSEEQAQAFSLADNKAGEWAEWDFKKLVDILLRLDIGDFDMDITGFQMDEIEDMVNKFGERPVTEEEDFDAEEEVEKIETAFTLTGDIWTIGKHKVICGDATNLADIKALVGKQDISLVITDPPYNVNYVGKTKDALKIQNDKMADTQFYDFLLAIFKNIKSTLEQGGPFYIFHADSEGLTFRKALQDSGLMLHQVLVWVKNTIVMGHSDYHWQHEPIIYGWKDGAAHPWHGFRDKSTVMDDGVIDIEKMKKDELLDFMKELLKKLDTTVIRENKPGRSADHPTMKPLPLIRMLMLNSSRIHQVVLDPFLRSGTTLIASEQLERICLGIELDPRYVDVCVKRYIKFRSGDTRGIKLIRNGKGFDLGVILDNWHIEMVAE